MQMRIRQIQEDGGSTKEESVEAFRRIIAAPFAQVVVSPLDPAALAAQQNDLIATHLSAQQEKLNLGGSLHARPELEEAYIPPSNEIEEITAVIWQKLLGIERIGINDNFLDLGGHSLLATQVIAQLQDAFEIELPINKLFEEPTIAGLARVIAETQLEQLEFDGTDDLLDEIESLSLDELRRELAAELGANSQPGGNVDG
jgi:acyl carrier protein